MTRFKANSTTFWSCFILSGLLVALCVFTISTRLHTKSQLGCQPCRAVINNWPFVPFLPRWFLFHSPLALLSVITPPPNYIIFVPFYLPLPLSSNLPLCFKYFLLCTLLFLNFSLCLFHLFFQTLSFPFVLTFVIVPFHTLFCVFLLL